MHVLGRCVTKPRTYLYILGKERARNSMKNIYDLPRFSSGRSKKFHWSRVA